MTPAHRDRTLLAAGLVVLLGTAHPAAAHQPPHVPRPTHPAAPGALTGEVDAHAATGVQALADLAGQSHVTVLAAVERTEHLDGGKLDVHHLRVERVLRGTLADPSVAVIEIRAGSSRPPLLAEGSRVVVVLEPAAPLSYLAETLPPGTSYRQVAGGRDGLTVVRGDTDVEAIVGTLDDAQRVRAARDATSREQALRTLAVDELQSEQPRLVEDGLLTLRRLPATLTLTSEELETLRRVLRDTDVPAATRIGLVRLLGERHWAGALAALDAVAVDRPEVLDALLQARTRLGRPPTRRELAPYLASPDPAVRAAGLRALAETDAPGALDEVGRAAVADGDPSVREAAIGALGRSKRPEAVPFLRQTFASDDPTIKQASARALLAMDEAVGSAVLIDLALHGDSSATRRYAALALVTTRGRSDPAVQRLLDQQPDPEVRELLERGFLQHDVHGAE